MSKKSCPLLYSNSQFKNGQDFLDTQYDTTKLYKILDHEKDVYNERVRD